MAGFSIDGHSMRRFTDNMHVQLVKVSGNVVDGTYPAANSYIDVQRFGRCGFLVAVGTTDDTSVAVKLVQATSLAGTNSKDVVGGAIAPTVLAGTNDNKWAFFELEVNHLDIMNGFRYVALNVAATGGTSTEFAAVFLGWRGYSLPPVFGTDLAGIVYVDG